jgi:hypothetical protein
MENIFHISFPKSQMNNYKGVPIMSRKPLYYDFIIGLKNILTLSHNRGNKNTYETASSIIDEAL